MSRRVVPPRNAADLTAVGQPVPHAPPAEAIARFRDDLQRITGIAPGPQHGLGVAVSGGGDSVALLLLARAAYPGSVTAATVDHGLRPEAAAEARSVADLCAAIGVPHIVLRAIAAAPAGGNVQDRARAFRYACLHDWARGDGRAAWVAVAHHRDDVAETFLMRAARGAGVGGLAQMRRHRPLGSRSSGVSLVRPLLDWSRAELNAVLDAARVGHVTDPSNVDPRYDRARVRALLGATRELPPRRLAMAARNLRDVEEAVEWAVLRELDRRFAQGQDGGVRLDPAGLPVELKRRLVIRAIDRVRDGAGVADRWRTTGVDRLVRTLDGGGGGTLAGVQARSLPHGWHFRRAPPRRAH